MEKKEFTNTVTLPLQTYAMIDSLSRKVGLPRDMVVDMIAKYVLYDLDRLKSVIQLAEFYEFQKEK